MAEFYQFLLYLATSDINLKLTYALFYFFWIVVGDIGYHERGMTHEPKRLQIYYNGILWHTLHKGAKSFSWSSETDYHTMRYYDITLCQVYLT